MKRSGFKSKRCAEGLAAPSLRVPVFKPKRCDARRGGCGLHFTPTSSIQAACSPACAQRFVERSRAKKEAAASAQDRRQTRERLETMKSLKQLRAEAQQAFNTYIRARDRKAGYGCICCGAPLDWTSSKPGGAVDAGHYISRGSAPELAFDERNVNAQRKGCNRPGGATRDGFRVWMIQRWGWQVVNELEGPHELPHLKHDDCRAIRAKYRAKAREIGGNHG